MSMDFNFQGKYLLSGKIRCVTGLHIGGTTESFEIGGMDNPVIKDPLTEYPYIPGSSLKGKLRHLLEWNLGKIEKHPKHRTYTAHFCGECEACLIFGPASDESEIKEKAGPTRLTVRDSFPTTETVDKWKQWLGEGVYTELKTENAINRITSEANPRTMERVPAGSEFAFEMIFDIYKDEDRQLLKSLFTAMSLLEDSALGGSGTRGHGKVKFVELKLSFRSNDYYLCKTDEEELLLRAEKDDPENPKKFKLSGKITGAISYEESLVKFVGSKLDEILGL